jgi:ssDNA-binding Zn-finger/Zn-ribbon topoisomerase 1
MHQTTHFFNLGYGWLCKHCSAENAERQHRQHSNNNGERKMPNLALAKWIDEEHHGLLCPRCGMQELVSRR